MAKVESTPTEKPRRLARKVLIPLTLVVAVGGFVTGMMGGPLMGGTTGEVAGAVVVMQTGPIPVTGSGTALQMVQANVSVRMGRAAPDGLGPLHDAMFDLLTQAAALPLVGDGRQSLSDLEKVVLSMAQSSAPWMVALQLQPADVSTAAAEPETGAVQTAS